MDKLKRMIVESNEHLNSLSEPIMGFNYEFLKQKATEQGRLDLLVSTKRIKSNTGNRINNLKVLSGEYALSDGERFEDSRDLIKKLLLLSNEEIEDLCDIYNYTKSILSVDDLIYAGIVQDCFIKDDIAEHLRFFTLDELDPNMQRAKVSGLAVVEDMYSKETFLAFKEHTRPEARGSIVNCYTALNFNFLDMNISLSDIEKMYSHLELDLFKECMRSVGVSDEALNIFITKKR